MADSVGISLKPSGSWRPKTSSAGTPSTPPTLNPDPRPDGPSALSVLSVEGMTCGNCARRVTDAARTIEGVDAAEASPTDARLTVWWKRGATSHADAVAAAVTKAGYPAALISDPAAPVPQARAWSPVAGWRFNLVLGSICTLPLMFGEWVLGIHHNPGFVLLGFVLATIALFGCGYRFARGAWDQIKVGTMGMDLLVSLGSVTAYVYSLLAWRLNLGDHLYFMECGAILTFISAGHWMEARVSAQAEGALRELLRLAPTTARRRKLDGSEEEVPIASLREGDLVVLKAGDRVPTDGTVSEGESSVDEAMLTGESLPVRKAKGSELFAGTSNLDGRLIVQVSATGESTALAHVISAVRRAQTSRARIQRLADRWGQIFVPSVIVIAIASAVAWLWLPDQMLALHSRLSGVLWHVPLAPTPWANALISAAAVLIIACPCAMGLATPAAIMAAANAASRRGILIRDGVALEKAGEISMVLFDKTGTLTEGKPVIIDRSVMPSTQAKLDEQQLVTLAASLADQSRHPLSRTIASQTSQRVALDQFQELRGKGLVAALRVPIGSSQVGQVVRLGALDWLQASSVSTVQSVPFVEGKASTGATIIGLSLGDELIACFALRDSIREESRKVISSLQARGLQVRVVSGDSRGSAEAIGKELGLKPDEIISQVRPEQKAEVIRSLQAGGSRVAFVGDGINDGPALAQADLGIAVTQASDVARESADLVLLRSDLNGVVQSIELSKSALGIIRQNLFWAFFYNVLAVPLAALGFMNPMLCAAAMGLSDVLVIGNSLRLLRWKV